MPLCNVRSTSVTLLLFAAATGVIAASALTVQVNSSRDVRLVIVDDAGRLEQRDAVHRGFTAAFRLALSRGGPPIHVRATEAGVRDARAALVEGHCDAVLLIGDRPAALRRVNAMTFCGELDPFGQTPIYLIVANSDPQTRAEFGRAFNEVLADRRLLESNAAYSPPAVAQRELATFQLSQTSPRHDRP